MALDEGKTCIDCHQGIAHRLPENYLKTYEEVTAELDGKIVVPENSGRDVATAGSEIKGYLASN
jgi:cytochrome c-type protein NapC